MNKIKIVRQELKEGQFQKVNREDASKFYTKGAVVYIQSRIDGVDSIYVIPGDKYFLRQVKGVKEKYGIEKVKGYYVHAKHCETKTIELTNGFVHYVQTLAKKNAELSSFPKELVEKVYSRFTSFTPINPESLDELVGVDWVTARTFYRRGKTVVCFDGNKQLGPLPIKHRRSATDFMHRSQDMRLGVKRLTYKVFNRDRDCFKITVSNDEYQVIEYLKSSIKNDKRLI